MIDVDKWRIGNADERQPTPAPELGGGLRNGALPYVGTPRQKRRRPTDARPARGD